MDARAVDTVLARHGIDRASGVYVQTRDGLDFELNRSFGAASGDHDELLLAMRGITAGLVELVFELADAAGLGVVVPDDEARVLVTRPELVRELPAEYAERASVCGSAEVLATFVLPVFERWRAWAM